MTVTLPKDFREFIQSLHAHEVKFILVGGYAVAYHGHPRYTGDIDFFLECTPANAVRVCAAIADFGLASLKLQPEDFTSPGAVVQLGRPPRRIDLLMGIDGVDFAMAWENREEVTFGDLAVAMVSKADLIVNKRATGRLKDLDDLRYLEG